MERIDRKYAIIYVDREGECLNLVGENERDIRELTSAKIIDDYYECSGPAQWNFYLIIAEEKIGDKYTKKQIESEEHYTRKFVVPLEKIDKFIEDLFPVREEEKSEQVTLIKGYNYADAHFRFRKWSEDNYDGEIMKGSIYRDKSSMESLFTMDQLRANLIRNKELKLVFYTHLSNEFSWAEKKFGSFLKTKIEEDASV